MKIFAYRFICKQKDKTVNGLKMRVGQDCLEEEKKLIEEIEQDYNDVEEGSIEIKSRESMSLEQLVHKLKPEFEKLVKTAKMKSELLDAISKLPID